MSAPVLSFEIKPQRMWLRPFGLHLKSVPSSWAPLLIKFVRYNKFHVQTKSEHSEGVTQDGTGGQKSRHRWNLTTRAWMYQNSPCWPAPCGAGRWRPGGRGWWRGLVWKPDAAVPRHICSLIFFCFCERGLKRPDYSRLSPSNANSEHPANGQITWSEGFDLHCFWLCSLTPPPSWSLATDKTSHSVFSLLSSVRMFSNVIPMTSTAVRAEETGLAAAFVLPAPQWDRQRCTQTQPRSHWHTSHSFARPPPPPLSHSLDCLFYSLSLSRSPSPSLSPSVRRPYHRGSLD